MKTVRLAACVAALLSAWPAVAHDGIHINDPYARIISGAGVVYFQIENMQTGADTLIAAQSDLGVAMLMHHAEDANGVMQMRMVMDGFTVDAGQVRVLQSAADHVMLSDVATKPRTGDTFTLVLTFARAGEVTVTVPVDNTRRTPPGSGPTPYDVMSIAVGLDAGGKAADPGGIVGSDHAHD